jgi:prophage regulatory protein
MPTQSNHHCPARLLSWKDVRARLGLSRSTVWRLMRNGTFPRSIKISPGRIAWLEADIEAYVTGLWQP